MNSNPSIDSQTIVNCFEVIHNFNTDPVTRKNADQYLIESQKNPLSLLPILMQIVQNNPNDQIKFQALLFFSNVIKRTWTSRKLKQKQVHSTYQGLKKNIRTKILLDLYQSPKNLLFTYYDILKFIVKIDFPHSFPQFSQLVIKLTEQISVDQNSVTNFKELREIFSELSLRKGVVSMKAYQQCFQPILQKMLMVSSYFQNQIHSSIENNNLSPIVAKLSKYSDQIILSTLRISPYQLLDTQSTLMIPKQLHAKLDHLLRLHQEKILKEVFYVLDKDIKSLIYDLSSLEQVNPFIISLFITDYFNTISQIVANPSNFTKSTPLKYTLLSMRKFIRQFSFYSPEEQFLSAIGPRQKSKNYLTLRKICHQAYQQLLNPDTVEGLLNHLIGNLMCAYCKSEEVSFDVQDNMIIDKAQEKELSMQNCAILLIEAILQKFTEQSHALIKNMVCQLFKNNFEGVDKQVLGNVLGVLALLPRTSKKNALYSLNQIPIIEILAFLYQNPIYKSKIPQLISGWFDYFSNDQLVSLINVLLDYIQNQNETSLVLLCCQSLDKIITQKKYLLNGQIISKIFPIAVRTFQKTDYPQVLWPMVNLLSNMIIQCQFDSDIILNALQNCQLSLLISNKSSILIQALSEMFKNILCVIPRNKYAQTVYKMACYFLNNHLATLSSVTYEKVLNLWYIVVRQYSSIQNCNDELIELYKNHYKTNLLYKVPLMIYILEEYMLLGFVQTDLTEFSQLIFQFYQQAEQMQKVESQQLKIASLSFQITLITKYTLKQVNNEAMLKAILKDFYCLDQKIVSATVHNSLLSIINRYIILHRDDFFSFLSSVNVDLIQFYNVYVDNMNFLTSESAKKINTIAVLTLMPCMPNDFLISKLHYLLMIIIPSVENYMSTLQVNPLSNSPFTGKVMNSPTHRFASNFLSQRKQQVRKKDMFQEVNIKQLFVLEIQNLCEKLGTNVQIIAQNFPQTGWFERFQKILMA